MRRFPTFPPSPRKGRRDEWGPRREERRSGWRTIGAKRCRSAIDHSATLKSVQGDADLDIPTDQVGRIAGQRRGLMRVADDRDTDRRDSCRG